eukprot:5561347-Amphidinium_carterae.1
MSFLVRIPVAPVPVQHTRCGESSVGPSQKKCRVAPKANPQQHACRKDWLGVLLLRRAPRFASRTISVSAAWMHMDVAGASMCTKGMGVRLLILTISLRLVLRPLLRSVWSENIVEVGVGNGAENAVVVGAELGWRSPPVV